MKASKLREMNGKQLQEELVNLLQQKFDINLRSAAGNKKAIRRDVARIKTVMTEKAQEK